jgi:hypothetical protein
MQSAQCQIKSALKKKGGGAWKTAHYVQKNVMNQDESMTPRCGINLA